MQIQRVLVVDDELLMREFITETLQRAGCDVVTAGNGEEACAQLDKGEVFDLVISDVRMDRMTGLDVLAHAKKVSPQTLVTLITAHAELDSVMQAMRLGAFDYLTKPLAPDQIEVLLAKAAEHLTLVEENRFYRQNAAKTDDGGFEDLVGRSEPMREVLRLVSKVAGSSATVLVTGSSGTGKELIARALHQRSDRSEKPFIRVNCAALPETLLESELFGHERGAFTGAVERRAGRFELAHTGTLLLDEITETSLALQSKLLRVLQEREFERVGGTKTLKVDVRVICTSNRDLQKAVKEGKFREDLYYRLNVVPIKLPPLRERENDVLLLSDYFLRRFADRHNRPAMKLDESGRAALLGHRWPGNVRELENTIERAVLLNEGTILTGEGLGLTPGAGLSMPASAASSSGLAAVDGTDLNQMSNLADVEREIIQRVMRQKKGNRTKAARQLGISVRTLYTKLKEYEAAEKREAKQAEMAGVN